MLGFNSTFRLNLLNNYAVPTHTIRFAPHSLNGFTLERELQTGSTGERTKQMSPITTEDKTIYLYTLNIKYA